MKLPAKSRGPVRLENVVIFLVLHLACVTAPFYFSWSGLILCGVLFWIGSGLGITLGWHRMLTHGAFKTYRPVKLLLTLVGCINLQNGPIEWVGTHRLHHGHTDEQDDPHSPRHGFFWSHARWVFYRTSPDPKRFARDLLRDRAIARIDRVFWLVPLLLAGAMFGGGWWVGGVELAISWLVWGV
ncbi:MAG: fatty acid desaturase, partial [Planctomycetota bacterium]